MTLFYLRQIHRQHLGSKGIRIAPETGRGFLPVIHFSGKALHSFRIYEEHEIQ